MLGDLSNQERIDLDVILIPGTTTLRLCPSTTFNEPASVTDSIFIGSAGEIMINSISFEEDAGICPTLSLNEQLSLNIRDAFMMQIDTSVCQGNSIEIGGEFFTRDTILNRTTRFGCDSTIVLNIQENLSAIEDISRQLCDGQSFDEIPGFSFTDDIDTTINLIGGSATGCDSTINLILDFQNITIGLLTPEICEGEFIEIDGVIIDAQNPIEDIPSQILSVFGCDSVTRVIATILPLPDVGTMSLELCPDESQTIGDITYDINTTSGTSTLIDASTMGCDSMVNVTVEIQQEVFDMTFDLCVNDTLRIGSDIYTAGMTSGMSNTGMQSTFGCDSILNVSINVLDLGERAITRDLCEDENIVVGNQTFNFSNPSGMVTVPNIDGCDSLFTVTINELRKDETILELSFCEDRDTMINGTIYNAGNTMGEAVLMNEFGCDSTVMVNLFVGSTTATLLTSICPGENSGTLEISSTEGLTLPLSLDIPSASISVVVESIPFVIDIPSGEHEITLDDGECTFTQTVQTIESNTPILMLSLIHI